MKSRDKKLIVKLLDEKKLELTNLLPEHLQKDFEKESYISGGAIYSVYNEVDVKDYDFFIKSEGLKQRLLEYFEEVPNLKLKWFDSKPMRYGKYKNLSLTVTSNAISIGKFQIVMRDVGEAVDVVGRFDFKHNMFYVEDSKFNGLVDEMYLDKKELYYNESRARDIVSTIMRANKFREKGWKVPPREMAKMLIKLNEVGFTREELDMLSGRVNINSFGS